MAAVPAARPASTPATIAGGSARHSYTTSGDVTVYAVVVCKEMIYSPTLRTDHDRFYNYFMRLLLEARISIDNARIRLDGSGGRDFERALKSYLRRELGDVIRDFRMVDSKRDHLAQLADMCIGAIARSYRPQRVDPARWRNMLAPRITNIWQFK
jgi:hypothetical protein